MKATKVHQMNMSNTLKLYAFKNKTYCNNYIVDLPVSENDNKKQS